MTVDRADRDKINHLFFSVLDYIKLAFILLWSNDLNDAKAGCCQQKGGIYDYIPKRY